MPGHRGLTQATKYEDYKDIRGNNEFDMLANMGDKLPMDTPPPKPHDVVLHGQIMPTPVKT